jgi:hypothetical protein
MMMTLPAPDRTDVKRTAVKRRLSGRKQHGIQGGSREANRIAVAILEVLAGARSPAEAATALKVSLPRYYILEKRALEGLVVACEPKPLGKQPSPETRIAALERQLEQARRQCARQEALVRVAQRSVGLPAAEPQKAKTSSPRDRRGRKKRRPAVRALKAAEALRNRVASSETSEVQPGHLADRPTEIGRDGNGAPAEGAQGTSAGAEG